MELQGQETINPVENSIMTHVLRHNEKDVSEDGMRKVEKSRIHLQISSVTVNQH